MVLSDQGCIKEYQGPDKQVKQQQTRLSSGSVADLAKFLREGRALPARHQPIHMKTVWFVSARDRGFLSVGRDRPGFKICAAASCCGTFSSIPCIRAMQATAIPPLELNLVTSWLFWGLANYVSSVSLSPFRGLQQD